MTEHVHEWFIVVMVSGEPFAMCKDENCAEILTAKTIDKRLAATERLSAEDAEQGAQWILDTPSGNRIREKLRAYADILERKQKIFTGGTVGTYFDTSRPDDD